MSKISVFDFSYFPTLKTERLILRKLRLDDAPAVFVSWSDFEVQKYNAPIMTHIDEARDLIDYLLRKFDDKAGITWGITRHEDDTVMGMCGYNGWNQYHRRADIGYDLARKYWGNAYAREAVQAIVKFGFEKMYLNRVEAETIKDNYGSVNLLKKLNFTLEGVRRGYSWEDDGTFHNSAIFGILRDDFMTSD